MYLESYMLESQLKNNTGIKACNLFYSKHRRVLADIGMYHAEVERLKLKLLGSKWNNKALPWPFIGFCNRAENKCGIIDGCSHTYSAQYEKFSISKQNEYMKIQVIWCNRICVVCSIRAINRSHSNILDDWFWKLS